MDGTGWMGNGHLIGYTASLTTLQQCEWNGAINQPTAQWYSAWRIQQEPDWKWQGSRKKDHSHVLVGSHGDHYSDNFDRCCCWDENICQSKRYLIDK